MNTALVQELEHLLQETRVFLALSEIDIVAWEEYGERRATIFARLQAMDFRVAGEKERAVSSLIHEILQQDALVMEKAQARLASLRAELRTLATSRCALRGYAPSQPALLLERCW